MLIVTRRTGEEIVIRGVSPVQVLAINGQRTRVGVAAPEAVRVDRGAAHKR